MIAVAGYYNFLKGHRAAYDIAPLARMAF